MILFKDREDAGGKLADRIAETISRKECREAVVLGIPRGGIAVGYPVARKLRCPLVPLSLRKLPVPDNDQMGFGAVALGRQVILNEPLIDQGYVRREDVDLVIDEVYAEVLRRDRIYRGTVPFPDLAGKFVVIVDDGLATGYTMLAAIQFARKKGAEKPFIAVPVAHREAFDLIRKTAGRVAALHVSTEFSFAVASFFEDFPDLTDTAVVNLLQENRKALNERPAANR